MDHALLAALALQSFHGLQWLELVVGIALLALSLSLHEAAHAWTALKCGDTTGRDLGRITWNPLPHIDPVMTIAMPAMLFFLSGGRLLFGGAKPVPVNFYNLRKPYPHMALVAFAGPFTNFLLASVFYLLLKVVVLELGLWPFDAVGSRILQQAVAFNLLLAAFNLIPIPPLDGSRILAWLLPESLRAGYRRMEGVGMLAIFVLIFFVPPFQRFLWETIQSLERAVAFTVSLGGVW